MANNQLKCTSKTNNSWLLGYHGWLTGWAACLAGLGVDWMENIRTIKHFQRKSPNYRTAPKKKTNESLKSTNKLAG